MQIFTVWNLLVLSNQLEFVSQIFVERFTDFDLLSFQTLALLVSSSENELDTAACTAFAMIYRFKLYTMAIPY